MKVDILQGLTGKGQEVADAGYNKGSNRQTKTNIILCDTGVMQTQG